MHTFTKKIKNIFNGRKTDSEIEYEQDKEFTEARWSISDIAKSIRESGKFQAQKKWRWDIFNF